MSTPRSLNNLPIDDAPDPGATESREAGRYAKGQTATSVLLDGLTVDMAAVLAESQS